MVDVRCRLIPRCVEDDRQRVGLSRRCSTRVKYIDNNNQDQRMSIVMIGTPPTAFIRHRAASHARRPKGPGDRCLFLMGNQPFLLVDRV